MRKTIIIGCSQRKKGKSGKAQDLYDGTIWQTFRKHDKGKYRVFALSAKYGLVPADKVIRDYDTLLGRDVSIEKLAKKVKQQKKKYRLGKIYLFAGKQYAKVLEQAGYEFTFITGGIGDKRKKLRKML